MVSDYLFRAGQVGGREGPALDVVSYFTASSRSDVITLCIMGASLSFIIIFFKLARVTS